MERQKKIVDASVAVKWFLNEKDSDKALKIREDHISGKIEMVVPELIFLEVANALKCKKLNVERILYANKSLWISQFDIPKADSYFLEKAIENSIKYNITVYDALYVTLAQIHGAFLITADKELYKIPNVIALEKT
ncbi:type II toxin-antitoxin system VapC family toxin [Candidatus Pacearchaeota archaeon]|nr:type II toxin-antitoxin system VapC family toxin [Candidatus Pacearchaeota archaeon]